jgi:hypothetical protein
VPIDIRLWLLGHIQVRKLQFPVIACPAKRNVNFNTSAVSRQQMVRWAGWAFFVLRLGRPPGPQAASRIRYAWGSFRSIGIKRKI